jgi:hypothetical protein
MQPAEEMKNIHKILVGKLKKPWREDVRSHIVYKIGSQVAVTLSALSA